MLDRSAYLQEGGPWRGIKRPRLPLDYRDFLAAAQVCSRVAVALLCCLPSLGLAADHGGGTHRGGNHRIRVTPDLAAEPGFMFTAETNIYRSSLYVNAFAEYQTEVKWSPFSRQRFKLCAVMRNEKL